MAQGAIWDAAVVGAGPAGSAAAALLAARGFKVLLLDRAIFPRAKPCAEYLGPGALFILRRIGLSLPRSASWSPIAGMRIVAPDGTEFEGRFPASQSGIGIRRELLDTALMELAARRGAWVLEGVTVTDLRYEDRRVVLIGRTHDHLALAFETRLLIGADGLHSRIARRLGLARRGKIKRTALVRHAQGLELQNDLAEIHLGPGGYSGLAPVGDGLVNIAIVTGRRRPPALSLEGWFGALALEFPELAGRLREATFVDRPQAVGPFALRCRSAVAHRALLVGDAAEFYDPLTGDGIYAALRGAELIDRYVARNLERDALSARQLGRYRRARHRALLSKRLVERVVVGAAGNARFPVLARFFGRHPLAADLLVGITGHGGLVRSRERRLPSLVGSQRPFCGALGRGAGS